MDMTGRARARRAAAYFLVWTAVGLFFFSQDLTRKLFWRDPTPWWHNLVSWLLGVYICALLTPAILWLGRRFPIDRRNWLRRGALHLLCSVSFSLVELVLDSVAISRLGLFPTIMKGSFWVTLIVLLVLSFHNNILMYWTILGIQYAFQYYQRYQERRQHALRLEVDAAELQSQLVQAQLGALKAQLQPHFLFNTLNAIMVLVRQRKGEQAEEMLALLSDLLRCVLEDVEAQEVPLRRELEYVRLYLAIEQVRFQDRLRVEISAPPELLDAALPHMSLQPLVENAVRHGIGRRSAAGRIAISAARTGDALEIRITDDGPGLPPGGLSLGAGIGLANTRARLQQLYAERASLTIENAEQGGARVVLSLPWHTAAAAASRLEAMEVHAVEDADRR
jgi:sensor histidine kinase YesM